jgi:hypothetical protein
MRGKRIFAALISALALLFAMTTTVAARPQAIQPGSDIDPDNFVSEITNPFFPLAPGTTFYYAGEKEGVPISDVRVVTHETKVILGVTCTVVHDQAYEDGVLVEDTFDWFAQDEEGNVWYFGEDTKELDENGNVISTEGSWEAGVDGAQPGIIMEAHPKVGDRYQQELAPGVAEDMAQVIRLQDEEVCVSYGCFEDDELLLTKEWTPLDRGVVEEKYYAEDVGFILGVMVKGGDERIELVRITTEHQDD